MKMKHIRIYSEPPKKNKLTEFFGCFALIALFSGVLFWGLDSSFQKMTTYDCEQGVQAACEDLKK